MHHGLQPTQPVNLQQGIACCVCLVTPILRSILLQRHRLKPGITTGFAPVFLDCQFHRPGVSILHDDGIINGIIHRTQQVRPGLLKGRFEPGCSCQ